MTEKINETFYDKTIAIYDKIRHGKETRERRAKFLALVTNLTEVANLEPNTLAVYEIIGGKVSHYEKKAAQNEMTIEEEDRITQALPGQLSKNTNKGREITVRRGDDDSYSIRIDDMACFKVGPDALEEVMPMVHTYKVKISKGGKKTSESYSLLQATVPSKKDEFDGFKAYKGDFILSPGLSEIRTNKAKGNFYAKARDNLTQALFAIRDYHQSSITP